MNLFEKYMSLLSLVHLPNLIPFSGRDVVFCLLDLHIMMVIEMNSLGYTSINITN